MNPYIIKNPDAPPNASVFERYDAGVVLTTPEERREILPILASLVIPQFEDISTVTTDAERITAATETEDRSGAVKSAVENEAPIMLTSGEAEMVIAILRRRRTGSSTADEIVQVLGLGYASFFDRNGEIISDEDLGVQTADSHA